MEQKPNPKYEPKSSLAKKLAERKAQKEGKSLTKVAQELLSEHHESLLYSRDFFDALSAMDSIGIGYLRNVLGYSLPKATKEWFSKSMEKKMAFLAPLVENYKVLSEALETIREFHENPLLYQTLLTVVDEISRKTRKIYSELQLTQFLTELKIDGLALELPTRPGGRRAFNWDNSWYTSSSLNKAKLAWPFVLMALGRVRSFEKLQREVISRIQLLLDQATEESEPEAQYLQKLLTIPEKPGTLVIWDTKSQILQKGVFVEAGLLAILLGRLEPGANLLLGGWEADVPLSLPKDEAYELPPLFYQPQLDGRIELGFIHINLPQEEQRSLKRIEVLIRHWIRLEGKFVPPALPQPSPESQVEETNQ